MEERDTGEGHSINRRHAASVVVPHSDNTWIVQNAAECMSYDFRWACPSGITTGRLQRAQRVVPLSIGLAPMEAATVPLFRRNATSTEFAQVRQTSTNFAILHPSDFIQDPISVDLHPQKNVGQVGQVPFFQAFLQV